MLLTLEASLTGKSCVFAALSVSFLRNEDLLNFQRNRIQHLLTHPLSALSKPPPFCPEASPAQPPGWRAPQWGKAVLCSVVNLAHLTLSTNYSSSNAQGQSDLSFFLSGLNLTPVTAPSLSRHPGVLMASQTHGGQAVFPGSAGTLS